MNNSILTSGVILLVVEAMMDYTLLMFIAIRAYCFHEFLIKYIYNSVILINIFLSPSRMVCCPQRLFESCLKCVKMLLP